MLSWAPDAIDIAPELLQTVVAVPTMRGYKTPPAGVDMDGAQFSGTPQGGAYLYGLSGTSRTFVGTATYLYEYVAKAWTDRSRGGNYTAGAARWRFAQFGDTELAINKATVLQSSTTAAFANVSNSPKAALIEVCAGFVMLANTDDTGLAITGGPNADQPHRWWCSQIFNPTGTWAPDASTQATTGLLVETPGGITALRRLGNDLVAYKKGSIYVGRYVGPPAVWQWQCVSTDVGCESQECVVAAGRMHYFIGDSDIYAFDGQTATPIGSLIREWFFDELSRPNASGIQALHDRSAKIIYWFYPTSGSTLDSCLAYHYDTQRWGHFDITVTDVLETITDQITYASLGDLYSTYGDLPAIAYGSPFWNASTPVLAYMSATNYITSLSGTASTMSLRTGWFGDEGMVTVCTRVRPRWRTAPASATLTNRSVMNLGDAATTGATSTMHDGRFDLVKAARYHQFDLSATGACEIEAVAPKLTPQGQE